MLQRLLLLLFIWLSRENKRTGSSGSCPNLLQLLGPCLGCRKRKTSRSLRLRSATASTVITVYDQNGLLASRVDRRQEAALTRHIDLGRNGNRVACKIHGINPLENPEYHPSDLFLRRAGQVGIQRTLDPRWTARRVAAVLQLCHGGDRVCVGVVAVARGCAAIRIRLLPDPVVFLRNPSLFVC